MPNYEIKITDTLEKGKCPGGHKVGDVFTYPIDRGKMCPTAFHSIFPTIRIMQNGGKMLWFDTPDSHSNYFPNYKRPVVFKTSRTEKLE